MITAISSIHESDDHGQALLNEVVQLFTDLLNASGATMPMIKEAMATATSREPKNLSTSPTFVDLGSILRDCMEVMCAWRRDLNFVDAEGEPVALQQQHADRSFEVCVGARGAVGHRQKYWMHLWSLVQCRSATMD